MLDTDAIELAISRRLNPLRKLLESKGIPLAFLPKETSNYSPNEQGAIRLVCDTQRGRSPNIVSIPVQDPSDYEEAYTVTISQDIEADILIRLSLSKRYQDSENEPDVLNFIARKIVMSLLGFYPLPLGSMRSPLCLKESQLLQPQGGRWIAQVVMCFAGRINSIEEDADRSETVAVQLFSNKDMEFLETQSTLIRAFN